MDGYGKVRTGRRILKSAHRISYEFFKGPIGDRQVLHSCDTPCCVNPDHLFLGYVHDNRADQKAKNRYLTGESHGSAKLTNDDVTFIRTWLDCGFLRSEVAKAFNVTWAAVESIRKGVSWGSLAR